MPRKSETKPHLDLPEIILDWHIEDRHTRVGSIPVVDFYLQCLEKNDGSQKLAIQFTAYAIGESSLGVGITDSVFIQDQNRFGRSILDRHNGDARAVERLRKALKRNGYNLKSDDHYIPTIAKRFGDPDAIVNHTQGMGDLRRRLEKRRTTVEGEISVKGEATPVQRQHKLHPRIVERIRQQKIKQNPDLAHKDQRELREAIIDKHGAKK